MRTRLLSLVPAAVALSACPRQTPSSPTDAPAEPVTEVPESGGAPEADPMPADGPPEAPPPEATPTDAPASPGVLPPPDVLPSPDVLPASENPTALTGRDWHLVRLDGEPPPDGANPWFRLEETGGLTGYAGCNGFSGAGVTVEGDRIAFGSLRTTRRACPHLSFEQAFIGVLTAAVSWRREGPALILATKDGDRAWFEAR